MEPVSAASVVDLAECVLDLLPPEQQPGLSSVIDMVRRGTARPSTLTELVKDLKRELLSGSALAMVLGGSLFLVVGKIIFAMILRSLAGANSEVMANPDESCWFRWIQVYKPRPFFSNSPSSSMGLEHSRNTWMSGWKLGSMICNWIISYL